MNSRLIHPQLLSALNRDFFSRKGTVQEGAKTQSTTGQEKKTWSNVPGMIDIPCRIAAGGGGERRQQSQAFLDATDTALLSGVFAGLTELNRFVDDKGNIYDILRVELDSEGITTRLTLRTVR